MASIKLDRTYGGYEIQNGNTLITKVERIQSGTGDTVVFENNNGVQTFYDYTCEYGISYTYKINNGTSTVTGQIVTFDDPILYGANLQKLALSYNVNISGLKRNQSESVVATLGGRYPFVVKNGKSDYYSFTIGSLLSVCTPEGGVSYANDDMAAAEYNYRKSIIDFLCDGNPKLFKSPQEGSMLVRLTGVTLSPETKLGRNLYNFSATATEIAECTPENLKKYGLYAGVAEYVQFYVADNGGIPFYVKEV